MGQSPSSAVDQEVKGTHGKGSSSLFSEHEVEELSQTFKKICQPNKVEDGFTLPQLQGFIGGKLPSSIVIQLHKELKAKNIPGEIKISQNAFMATLGYLMNGTVDQQSRLMFSLFADEGTNAVSVGHLSKLIGSLLQSYEEALQTCNQMKNWELVCTPESNQNFIDLVMRIFSAGGKTTASPVSTDEFERWLQQTPLMQKVFTAVFHLCFVDSSKTPAAAASPDDSSDASVLFHMPCLPACLDINWRKVRSQLHIPTLLILNHHLPRHLQDQWRFCFSSNLHGASFATLLSHIKNKGPTVVLVRDTDGNVFGGFASQSWELGSSFVGRLSLAELPTLPDSAEKNSMKIHQSFHVLMNKLDNLPGYGNFVSIILNVILSISLIVVQNLPERLVQMLASKDSPFLFIALTSRTTVINMEVQK